MKTPFIHDDWLLQTPLARRLYHEIAAPQAIIDYHCHLPPGDIARNRRFQNLFEIWLEGDHYKWRAMRTNGAGAEFLRDADPYDKFLAWARTVPHTLRNPLYHWTHLELQRYFGIDALLNEQTAPAIWEQANARLADADRDVHGILKSFGVEVVCTTDDPVDSLAEHRQCADSDLKTKVLPAFRPDKLLKIEIHYRSPTHKSAGNRLGLIQSETSVPMRAKWLIAPPPSLLVLRLDVVDGDD